jgi:hypothetical protein
MLDFDSMDMYSALNGKVQAKGLKELKSFNMTSRHRHKMVRRLSFATPASVSVRTSHSFRQGILDGSKE